MSKDTLFTNDLGAASGTTDYVKDVFDDVSLPATNNTNLTSTASTNPLGSFFANDDSPHFGPIALAIKDLVLIEDRTKWISNKPTYKILWDKPVGGLEGYLFGNFSTAYVNGQVIVTIKTIGDGIGLTGVYRQAAIRVQGDTAATATAQVTVDGSNTTTVSFNSLAADSNSQSVVRRFMLTHSASLETKNIHDIRFTALQVNTLKITGVTVYAENTGGNLDIFPGTTYGDKNKNTTTVGGTMAVPTFGSSLGGKSVIYKSILNAYTQSALSASTPISIAQGSSGTNLLNVSTGDGSKYPIGSGVIAPNGTSMYVGFVTNQSTDTLTISPTLSFGISSSIYRHYTASNTATISATLFSLARSFDFATLTLASTTGINQYFDPNGRFALWGQGIGVTTFDSKRALFFLGATTGFFQLDGYFSAADVEMIGNGVLHATFGVNGIPAWGLNTGQTGTIKRSVMSDAGPGWNSFVVTPGSSLTGIAFTKFNMYERARDQNVTTGLLAEIESLQTYTERSAINATMVAPGTFRRVYADQLLLQGSWVRGLTGSVPGGAIYYGASTNSALRFNYYGKDFAILGTAGSLQITIDGASTSTTFNSFKTVASEGFHSVVATSLGATTQIYGIDFARSKNDLLNLQNLGPLGATTAAVGATFFSLVSSAEDGRRVCTAYIGSGGAVNSQDGDFILSINKSGTGTYQITLKPGVFGATPRVFVSVINAGSRIICVDPTVGVTSTRVDIVTQTDAAVAADNEFFIKLVGAR